MLKHTSEALNNLGAFNQPNHLFIEALVNSIPFDTVPHKMKILFALSHVSSYVSNFRRNAIIWDGTEVPPNNISFVLAGSGANKDSSNSVMRKCFSEGLKKILKEVDRVNKEAAIAAATASGEELPEQYEVYKNYLKPIPPVYTGMSTGPGLVQHINDVGRLPLLSTSLYTGELSDELAINPHATENIKILSEVYDVGTRVADYTKGKEFRAESIDNQPVSALLVGSPGHILHDESTRKKFELAFVSKLARRSWFCYVPKTLKEPDFTDAENPIEELLSYSENIEKRAKQGIELVQSEVELLTEHNIPLAGRPIPVSDEVFKLFKIYQRYNSEYLHSINDRSSLYALVRAHLQWKALKLATAFAILQRSDEVAEEHYIPAMQYCELFDSDIVEFTKEINKAPHEFLADYLKDRSDEDGLAFINTHDIKKKGFSPTVSLAKIQELVTLCAGYDRGAVYTVVDKGTGIQYEAYKTTEIVGVSYKPIDNTALNVAVNNGDSKGLKQAKITTARNTVEGYKYLEASFEDLGQLLTLDRAYSPFRFKDGTRGRDRIEGGTKWVVFDVDKTHLSNEDMHMILQGINHHIALSSDNNNKYRYRVLVELDSFVLLSPVAWGHFYSSLADSLGIAADQQPQSQIFYSYAGRDILSCLDGTPVECRDFVMEAKEMEAGLGTIPKTLSKNQMNSQLQQAFDTFHYAFECKKGRRSVSMFKAMKHAKDLGADKEYVKNLLMQINEYLVNPLEDFRFNGLLNQVERMYEC